MSHCASALGKDGAAGAFDIDLPLNGAPGIECRSGGANNEYQIVTTFTTPISSASAFVTAGAAAIKGGRGSATVNGADVTVDLEQVANAQAIEVEIDGVTNGIAFRVNVPMKILIGDTNGNGTVNATDISFTKARVGQVVDGTHFLYRRQRERRDQRVRRLLREVAVFCIGAITV